MIYKFDWPIFLHLCATYSELPSNKSTMVFFLGGGERKEFFGKICNREVKEGERGTFPCYSKDFRDACMVPLPNGLAEVM